MRRLCFAHLAEGLAPQLDPSRLIRLDNLEMRDDVQQEVAGLWPQATTENVEEISDLVGYRRDFSNLFGFDIDGVDYEAPAETEITLDA
jgi:enoyl-[acyl-carrier protein] reductase/trans-2-enoyl-CoA reductase (NAD+)